MSQNIRKRKNYYDKEVRDRAKLDYMAGVSIREISLKYDITRTTIYSWKKKENWQENKEKAILDATTAREGTNKQLYDEYLVKVMQMADNVLEGVRVASRMALESLVELYNQEQSIRKRKSEGDVTAIPAMHKHISKISRAVSIMRDCADVSNRVMPAANDEMAEKILAEIKKLNEQNQLRNMPRLSDGTFG